VDYIIDPVAYVPALMWFIPVTNDHGYV
jgi:hypothetical protein